jgi:UDP-2,4-diacetamido-2,4,6-trideoxy-beta-L-altropyranose hydrolase
MRKVLFRADGSAAIGLGHVIRSLALAEMLKGAFHCVFAIRAPSEALQEEIKAVCAEVILLPAEPADPEAELEPFLEGATIVVLDGYRFGTAYQRRIKEKGCALVCIDDIHAYHFVADLVINHGIAEASSYSKEPYTRLLLGTKYSLLRTPFLEQMNIAFSPKEENSVFLCFGGADATNLTGIYLRQLLKIAGLKKIHVVIGSAYQHEESLQQLIDLNEAGIVIVHKNVSASEMVKVIRSVQVAVVPGSTIAIECASTGTPMMCGFYVDNQHDIVQMLGQAGLAETIGDFTTLSEQVFVEKFQLLLQADARQWHERSRAFFDRGAGERLIKEFEFLLQKRNIHIRKAEESDVELFYIWANDLVVRQNAIHMEPIPFDSHCRWYSRKMKSEQTFIYIAALGEKAFGQVRFDYEAEGYLIDYSISADMRGKGLARPMLELAMQELQSEVFASVPLKALVKAVNHPSKKVFESMGFRLERSGVIGSDAYLLFGKNI